MYRSSQPEPPNWKNGVRSGVFGPPRIELPTSTSCPSW